MQTLLIIAQLLPAIIAAIKAIEDAIPGQGQGEAKLAAVRGIIEAVDASYKNLWPQLQPIIGVLVGLFNKTGAFKA